MNAMRPSVKNIPLATNYTSSSRLGPKEPTDLQSLERLGSADSDPWAWQDLVNNNNPSFCDMYSMSPLDWCPTSPMGDVDQLCIDPFDYDMALPAEYQDHGAFMFPSPISDSMSDFPSEATAESNPFDPLFGGAAGFSNIPSPSTAQRRLPQVSAPNTSRQAPEPVRQSRTKGSKSSAAVHKPQSTRRHGSGSSGKHAEPQTSVQQPRNSIAIAPAFSPPESPPLDSNPRSHNFVERRYRNRLNAEFRRLMAILPAEASRKDSQGGSAPASRLSKARILDMAHQRICELERRNADLEAQQAKMFDKEMDESFFE